MKLFEREFSDEANHIYHTEYYLLVHIAGSEKVYGVEIVKTDASGTEREVVEGFSESREKAEGFLAKLADGLALPVELTALCDDYISEKN